MFINEMRIGDSVEGFFILQNAFAKTASNGRPFLSAVLEDKTGIIEGKVWDYGGPVSPADIGSIVKIRGTISEFRGLMQLNIDRIRLSSGHDDIALENLVPTAPLDAEKARARLDALVSSISDPDYRGVCRTLLDKYSDRFYSIPAAKSVHHGFLHGLLMHTLNMAETADFLAAKYGCVDRSLLLAGTILHDVAKCDEFVLSPLGLASEYSVKGELLGHLTMGAFEAAKCAEALGIPEEKSVLLQHMILSHHGEPEFGAAVRPVCAESELLSYIDMIDSRMEIYSETLAELEPGSFSKRIFSLDNKKIYNHG